MTQQSADQASATLAKRSIADALRSIAMRLGCDISQFAQARCVAVDRHNRGDRTVHVFERQGSGVVSLPSQDDRDFDLGHDEVSALIALACGAADQGTHVALRQTRLRVVDEPASVALLDEGTFVLSESRLRVGMVYDPRPSAMDMLRYELPAAEWAAGGGMLESPHRVGALVSGTLVALASVFAADGHVAQARVVVAPDFRRRGFGRLVLQTLAKHVLSEGLLPYGRLTATDGAARALANAVGFVHFAHTASLVASSVADNDHAAFGTTSRVA